MTKTMITEFCSWVAFIYCLIGDGVTSQPPSTSRHLDPTLYTDTRPRRIRTDTRATFYTTTTGNTDRASSEDRNDDAADARRRLQPRRAIVTRGNDELTACRRRRSKAFRIALGNAPA